MYRGFFDFFKKNCKNLKKNGFFKENLGEILQIWNNFLIFVKNFKIISEKLFS
jgi:hypothetical protein